MRGKNRESRSQNPEGSRGTSPALLRQSASEGIRLRHEASAGQAPLKGGLKEVAEKDKVWSFPTRVRCVDCGSMWTADGTAATVKVGRYVEKGLQYRECRNCGKVFVVKGELV